MRFCFLLPFAFARAWGVGDFGTNATVTKLDRDVAQEMGTVSQSFNMLSARSQKKISI